MRRFGTLLALLVLAAGATAGSVGCGKSYVDVPIRWQGDMESALASARAQNKPLFVFFGATWDTAAKELEVVTLVDPEVRGLLGRHFVSIHVDTTDDEDPRTAELQKRFKVVGNPTILVIDPDGTSEIVRCNEFVPPRALVRMLTAATKEDAMGEAQVAMATYRREQEARWEEQRRTAPRSAAAPPTPLAR